MEPMTNSVTHTYETIKFLAARNQIVGRLLLPSGDGPYPAVIVVHGSGPSSWDGGGGGLVQILESFASRGIAALSWDKPGVGESSGDWMFQTFNDRADEVVGAFEYLQTRRDINKTTIGMWGASQAGWIMPKVCALRSDVAFVIAVSCPVSTVSEQNLFRVEATMKADGYNEEAVKQALELVRLDHEYILRDASLTEFIDMYANYRNADWIETVHGEPTLGLLMFARGLAADDNEPDVATFRCPVLAVFGEKDQIVDIAAGTEHYPRVLSDAGNNDVSVRVFSNANHGMHLAETGGLEESDRVRESGELQFAPGYLDLIGAWVAERFLVS